MDTEWRPTHLIHNNDLGQSTYVMLTYEGVAYTEAELLTSSLADYTFSPEGDWEFQGQPFSGSVTRLP
jgi:hypothetical protein